MNKQTNLIPAMIGSFACLTAVAAAQTSLTSGSTVTDSVRKNNWNYYTIQVPSTSTGLQVDLVGTNNKDADLYIRQGANPTTSNWDFRPYQNTSNESVTVDANSNPVLAPGATYHIGVHTTDKGSAGYTLTATVTDPNGGGNPGGAADVRRLRVTWVTDPSTTATIGWEQVSGSAGTVHFDTSDHGTTVANYSFSKTVDRQVSYHGMNNSFARLSGLTPDTNYYFVIEDNSGASDRYYFRTAPATAQPFTFCAGGDSRNNRTPRQQANRLVGKLRPLFVAFTGDMINSDVAVEWQEWLDDWQETITSDGRIFPILPHRGNHESGGNQTVYNIFDTTSNNYYALNIGGDLMRFYVLNSEVSAGGTQLSWLQNDLNSNSGTTRHLCAGYHKPMRPHQSGKSEGSDEYNNWAQLFYDHGMDLVFESDSHVVKRTGPLMPSTGAGSDEGFIAVSSSDPNATIYTGEGCWGAPLRAADDSKNWTLAAGSFNSFDWVQVYSDRIDLRTVVVNSQEANTGSNTDADPFAIPSNLQLWTPASGTVLSVPGDDSTGGNPNPGNQETTIAFGSSWNYKDDGSDQGTAWRQSGVTETWPSGSAQLGYGDSDETTTLQSSHLTYYFRKEINITNVADVTDLDFSLLFDDGAIIYINGTEVHRTATMDAGTSFSYNTPSTATSSDNATENFSVNPSLLVEGANLIAVEVHNRSTTSSDISFDLQMLTTRSGETPPPSTTDETIFSSGASWNYKDDGSDQGTAWRQPGVTETWPSGSAQLGYGDGDESTTLQGSHITYYFRKEVNITNVSNITGIQFDLLYDDAAVIYINGTEVHRTSLLPSGPINYQTGTSTFSADNSTETVNVASSLLVEGNNLIAVEIHNQNTSSSDISFDLNMLVNRSAQ
ncbi:pre-peptidase C-terminal domain-containing protein [Rubritalea halochordaticola]